MGTKQKKNISRFPKIAVVGTIALVVAVFAGTQAVQKGVVSTDSLAASCDSISRGNLISNPSFEDESSGNWGGSGGDVSFVTVKPGHCSKSMLITPAIAERTYYDFLTWDFDRSDMQFGEVYELSFMAKSPDLAEISYDLHGFDANSLISGNKDKFTLTNRWKKYTVYFTATEPIDAHQWVYLRLFVTYSEEDKAQYREGNFKGKRIYMDRVIFHKIGDGEACYN